MAAVRSRRNDIGECALGGSSVKSWFPASLSQSRHRQAGPRQAESNAEDNHERRIEILR